MIPYLYDMTPSPVSLDSHDHHYTPTDVINEPPLLFINHIILQTNKDADWTFHKQQNIISVFIKQKTHPAKTHSRVFCLKIFFFPISFQTPHVPLSILSCIIFNHIYYIYTPLTHTHKLHIIVVIIMEPRTIIFILLVTTSMFMQLEGSRHSIPHISVMGMVYCDVCSNNSFNNNHSYFLSGFCPTFSFVNNNLQLDCNFILQRLIDLILYN